MTRRAALLAAVSVLTALAAAGCAGPGAAGNASKHVSLALERYSGGRYDLASARGRLVLVNFFATWCVPCVEEIPFLVRLQDRYRADGLEVVAISMDLDGRPVLAPFLELFRVNFPVLLADQRVFDGRSPFGPIPVLPTTVVIDRDGAISGVQYGSLDPVETERILRGLLKD